MKTKTLLSPILIIGLLAFIGISGTLLIQHKRNLVYRDKYQKANALLKEAKYGEALEIFENIYPKFKGELQTEILYNTGNCYQKTGRAKEAEECWNKILKSSYKFYHPVIYYELARQRLREGNFKQAEDYYSKIIEEFPSSALAGNAMLGPVDIYIAKGEIEKAREYCEEIIDNPDYSPKIKEIATDKLGGINMNLLLSPIPTNISNIYSVKLGDSLFLIAKKFNTTIPLLMKANNLKNSIIKPGQKIKVTINKFSISVNISKNELFLNYDGKLFKRYKIASGAHESPSPTGNFEIKEKIKDPTWYPVGKGVIPPNSAENILGARWMGLWQAGEKTSYGIHEAINPDDIGKYVSNGCIRLIKEDLEELYDIVTIGTKVTIIKSNQ